MKFEQVGINLQHTATSPTHARKLLDYSCNCCCNRGIHLDCDKCGILAVHKLIMSCFENYSAKKGE